MVNLTNLGTAFKVAVGHSKTFIKTNSPTIMIVGGIALGIGAAIMACKATKQAEVHMDCIDDDIAATEDAKKEGKLTEEETAREVAKVKVHWYAKIVKDYALCIAMGLVSIALILGSHSIMQKRCAALVTAYNALSTTLNTFYGHVKEELGEDKATELMYKSSNRVNPDSVYAGIMEADERCDPHKGVGYWKAFNEETSREFRGDYAHDYTFLKAQEMYANDKLMVDGVVTLNDVYIALGFEPTSEGLVVGWSLKNGDQYVDFGIDAPSNKAWKESNGAVGYPYLTFNPRGVIYGNV